MPKRSAASTPTGRADGKAAPRIASRRATRADPRDIIANQRVTAERTHALAAERYRLFAERVEQRSADSRAARATFDRFLTDLSGARRIGDAASNARVVPRGGSVATVMRAAMATSIQQRLNHASAAAHVTSGASQLKQYQGEVGSSREIPPSAAEQALGLGSTGSRVRKPPLGLTCRPKVPNDSCLGLVDGAGAMGSDMPDDAGPPSGQPVPPSDADDVAAAEGDVLALIHRLLKDIASPETAVVYGLEQANQTDASLQAGLDAVQKGIQGSTLHGGPADADALFDFHHIRLAFEPVWQELFDQKLIATGQQLYERFVAIGVDPNDYLGLGTDGDGLGLAAKLDLAKALLAADLQAAPPVQVAPPAIVLAAFEITPEEWARLGAIPNSAAGIEALIAQKAVDSTDGDPASPDAKKARAAMEALVAQLAGFSEAQQALVLLARELVTTISKDFFQEGNAAWMSYKLENRRQLLRQGQRIIAYVRERAFTGAELDDMHELLSALADMLRSPYRFTIYAANEHERSVNFGVIATYRQRWQPGDYQAGRLVKTVTLAPKEVRRYSKKVAVKRSRAEKEVNNSLSVRKTDSSEETRAETEIVQKAHKSTNFKLTAEGGVNIGIVDAKAGTAVDVDAGTESQETKKEFHDSVFKAAEEYKQERTVEVTLGDSLETQDEDSGEISNPNDEITVTYLFYELYRRFRVSEELHRLTPVIAVAQEVPTPDQITEGWVAAHDWILRRVILDDSFVPAMDYLSTKVVGDEVALRELNRNVEQQRSLVDDLKGDLVEIDAQVFSKYATLAAELEKHARAVEEEQTSGGFTLLPLPVPVLPQSADVSVDAAKERADTARADAERKERERRDVQARLDREVSTLTAITDSYTKALSDHLNRREQISRLLVHLKSNILYYMQAIWSHEVPDQRFFRLHQVQVPVLKGKKTYKLVPDPDAVPGPPDWQQPVKIEMHCVIDPAKIGTESLAEVADLDDLLGFKGNYMLFPLRKTNDVVDFLTLPYADPFIGLRDPDPLGGWTLSSFAEYLCCLRKSVSKSDLATMLPGLVRTYEQLITNGGNEDELIVPTGSLFIEALPGAHPILESFKLMHRAIDVKKVQAEARGLELENLRYAARLMEGEREDPTIEKKIVIEGEVPDVNVPPDA